MINQNFAKMPPSYLFAEIGRRSAEYRTLHPDAKLISMGIGDVTRPLAPAVVKAMALAAEEMGRADSVRGYPPYEGYAFLRDAIAKHDYQVLGVDITADEIYVSDGAKTDTSSIGDLFANDCTIAVCDPVYPVYVDANALLGRTGDAVDGVWNRMVYMPCTHENGYAPALPDKHCDIIYLCFPNNPTGVTLTKAELQRWVNFANEHDSVIIYDAAYKAFITEPDVPRSIYECDGAKRCAIECCSFSKTAGFTGARCGYMVIPAELERDGVALSKLWMRYKATRSNGVSYVTQKGAEAVYTPECQKSIAADIAYYQENAKLILSCVQDCGLEAVGGVNAPYIWLRTPKGMGSWAFFDHLLNQAQIIGTPGAGFGPAGEGCFRLTAFGRREDVTEALERLKKVL